MNLSPITALAPNLGAPAREPAKNADLFADLLGGRASAAPRPAAEPARDTRPAPAAKPAEGADRPPQKERNADARPSETREAPARDGAENQKTGASDGAETSAGSADGETQSAANDKAETAKANAKTKAASGEEAAVTANANASEIAAAVLALVQNGDAKAPAEVGALAANTAVTAAAAPATPAVTAKTAVTGKPAVTGVAPVPAEEPPIEDAPPAPGNSNKKGLGPVQVTVTDETKGLVSRPAATLTTANVQDFAEPAAPPAPADPKPVDPKAILNAAISPDDRTAGQPQSGKDGGGKPAPATPSAPALNLAADPAKALDPSGAAPQPTDKPVSPVQTQAPAAPPPAAAAVYAANTQAPAPAPSVSVAAHPAVSPAAAAANVDHVALQIGKAAADGMERIAIQLKPESLGRIDVQLQVHSDGRVHAAIAADRQDTLDLLQRDARALERALNDAGLRADAGSLSFNLNGRGGDGATGAPANTPPSSLAADTDAGEPQPAALPASYNAAAARGGVDIRV